MLYLSVTIYAVRSQKFLYCCIPSEFLEPVDVKVVTFEEKPYCNSEPPRKKSFWRRCLFKEKHARLFSSEQNNSQARKGRNPRLVPHDGFPRNNALRVFDTYPIKERIMEENTKTYRQYVMS